MFGVELLSRLQFAFNVGFHILWPGLNIGLAVFLFICELYYLKTNNDDFKKICKFFTKIFALAFGMGVVTGIPMSFQFGLNFSTFSQVAAPIIAPLLGAEILTAFFLEAVFLGIMLFGWDRVSKKVHLLATICVVIGVHNSAFWILSVNSFMQTPAGVQIVDGVIQITSWFDVIFNPSFVYRFTHMIIASYINAGLFVSGIAAYYLLKNLKNKTTNGFEFNFAKQTFSVSTLFLMILVPLQILAGDLHGLNTVKYQPAKVAAMEGLWDTRQGAPLVLFAVPSVDEETNKYEISIPKWSSAILTHSLDGEVKGLKEWQKDERPLVSLVFYSFRVMVGLGFLYLIFVGMALLLRLKNTLYTNSFILKLAILLSPTGFVAIMAGWIVTETGRQPWIVQNILKVSASISPSITTPMVVWSLTFFVIMYSVLFSFFLYYLFNFIKKGPQVSLSN